MERSNPNPYASPTAVPDRAGPRHFRDLWVGCRLANSSFVVALLSLITAWTAVGALLTAELWFRWVGLSGETADSAYRAIGNMGVLFVATGAVACITTFVAGRWIHRVCVALLLLPYFPLVRNIVSAVWLTIM